MSSNDKKQILKNLIKFNKSLKNIKNEISNLNFDSKFELYIITKNDIKQILNRALKENIAFKELEEWANLIECRDDLGFEEEILQEIIFDFANPEINGLITKDKIKTALKELDMIA